jgi:uncharacterized protein (DUF849 family)
MTAQRHDDTAMRRHVEGRSGRIAAMSALLQVCLNGARTSAEHPGLPITPAELATAAAAAVAAGAQDIHLHPKDATGRDSLDPAIVAAALAAVRASVPEDVRIGVTTGAWTAPDSRTRAAAIRAWTTVPDHASVNWHEDGAESVARALADRGVAIEAGIYSGTEAARRFAASAEEFAGCVVRVLAEVTDTDPATARHTATDLLTALTAGGGTGASAPPPAPILLHGEDGGAWPVLRLAAELGLSMRIGLEDVLTLPDGSPAPDNATLLAAARRLTGPYDPPSRAARSQA